MNQRELTQAERRIQWLESPPLNRLRDLIGDVLPGVDGVTISFGVETARLHMPARQPGIPDIVSCTIGIAPEAFVTSLV